MDTLARAFKKLTKLRENLKDLSQEESYEVFKGILEGKVSDVKTSSFLTAMRVKGETPEELFGVVKAIRERMRFPESKEDALDLAPNYDGKNRTVYILPSALWFCSNLGIEFTSHFALRTPIKEGVTLYEVVSELGVDLKVSFSDQKDHAPDLYRLMPLRRELGFRTLINTVEKFLNPFRAKRIVVSVFHRPFLEKVEKLLEFLGFEDWTIVCGLEGGLEPFPDRPTYMKRKGKEIEAVDPRSLGLDMPKSVRTEDVLRDSVEINRMVVEGKERGGFLSWAVYTAGVLLYAEGKAESVKEGIDKIVATFL